MTDRTELRRLLDEATPGPWEAKTSEATMNDRSGWRIGHPRRPQAFFAVMRAADAQLIAAAVSALPKLLDKLDAAEAHRDSLTECSRIEYSDAERQGGEFSGYAEAHYPCPTIRALDATPETGGES